MPRSRPARMPGRKRSAASSAALGYPSVADPVGGERVVVEGGAGGVRVRLWHVVADTDQVVLPDDEHRVPRLEGIGHTLVHRRSMVELAAQELGERLRSVRDAGRTGPAWAARLQAAARSR